MLKTFINICLLKEGPEDLPHSYVLLGIVILLGFLISILIGSIDQNIKVAGLASILGLFFTFVFSKLLLINKPERFLQTFTAMIGVDAIISVVSVPSFYSLKFLELSELTEMFFSLTIFALLVWVVIVYGYIFSKALSIMMGYGVAISIGYAFLSSVIFRVFVTGNPTT